MAEPKGRNRGNFQKPKNMKATMVRMFSYLTRKPLLLAVAVCIGAGVIVYAVCAFAVKAVKMEDLPAKLRRKIKR